MSKTAVGWNLLGGGQSPLIRGVYPKVVPCLSSHFQSLLFILSSQSLPRWPMLSWRRKLLCFATARTQVSHPDKCKTSQTLWVGSFASVLSLMGAGWRGSEMWGGKNVVLGSFLFHCWCKPPGQLESLRDLRVSEGKLWVIVKNF